MPTFGNSDRKLHSLLDNHFLEILAKQYAKARKLAIKKSGLSTMFPEICPYTLEQMLDFGWLPSQKLKPDSER
ncbi:DUF29 family protein [Raphidiopsis sp. BLCC-F218]